MNTAATNARPTRRARSTDSAQRWDEIIHAAAESFYKKSYEGTSLQDIADAVGLLKGSVYHYIDTKEDLLFELVQRSQTIAMSTLEDGPDAAAAPASERLRSFIHRWIELKNSEREWMIVAEREFGRLSAPYLKKVKANRRIIAAHVEGLIREGIDAGEFDPELDAELARDMVFELMKSSHLYRRPRLGSELAELSDRYATFALRGLGASAPALRKP